MSLPLRYSLLLPVAVVAAACADGKPTDDSDTDVATDDTDVGTDDTDDAPTDDTDVDETDVDDTDVVDTDETDVADTDDTDVVPVAVCGDGTTEPGELCFGVPAEIDAEGTVTALAIGLWDGEGADVIFGMVDEILWSDGDGLGGFRGESMIKADAALDMITDLDVGQLDNDTNLDVLYGSSNSSPKVLFGSGSGTVATETFTNTGEGYANDVLIVDFVGSAAVEDVAWFGDCSGLAQHNGTQDSSHTVDSEYPLSCTEQDAGTLARHQTGKNGLILIDGVTLTLFPFVSDGEGITGEATSTVTLDAAGLWVTAGDLDGDADEDVVVLDADGNVEILFADGAGGWDDQGGADFATTSVGVGAADMVLVDIDDDGDLDVVVTLTDDDQLGVLVNDGAGTFTRDDIELAVDAAPTRIAAGDLNGDGLPDLAVVTVTPDEITVLVSAP